MRTGDEALYWLESYFVQRVGYIVSLKIYGKDVPSNHIRVDGPEFFRFSFCSSWMAPQLSCSLTPDTFNIIADIRENVFTRSLA